MSSRSSGIDVRRLHESEFDLWRAFVDSAPAGSVYSYPEYLDVLCRAAGGAFSVLAAWKGGEIQGGIALYERDGRAGRVLSGRLLLYYNGLVLRKPEVANPHRARSRELAVLSSLERALSDRAYAHTEIRNRHPITDLRPFLSQGWDARASYSLVIGLENMEEAYGRVDQNQRRLIGRCGDSGATVTADGDFGEFFRLHKETHERKGAPLYLPKDAFETFFTGLQNQRLGRLYHCRLPDGTVAASQLVLTGGHPVTHTVTAGADPAHLKLGTTPFLRWKVCEELASEGYLGNDLTHAALNDVTRFKSQMGGALVTNLVLTREDVLLYRLLKLTKRTVRRGRSILGRFRGPYRRP